eukprot:1006616-Amphidinium_carterae.1
MMLNIHFLGNTNLGQVEGILGNSVIIKRVPAEDIIDLEVLSVKALKDYLKDNFTRKLRERAIPYIAHL